MKRVAAIVTAAVLVAAGGTTAFAYTSGRDVAVEERAPTKPTTGSQAPTFIRSGGKVVPVASGDDRRNAPDRTPPRSREEEPPQPLVGGRYDKGADVTDHRSGRGGRDEEDRRGRSDRDRDDGDRDDGDRDDGDRDDGDRDDGDRDEDGSGRSDDRDSSRDDDESGR